MALSSASSNSAICASMALVITITSLPSFFTASINAAEYLLPVCMLPSSTLATYKICLSVSKNKSSIADFSSLLKPRVMIFFPSSKCFLQLIRVSSSTFILGSVLASFSVRCIFFSTLSRSFNCSSVSMISLSLTGFIGPSSLKILSSSKQRIT